MALTENVVYNQLESDLKILQSKSMWLNDKLINAGMGLLKSVHARPARLHFDRHPEF